MKRWSVLGLSLAGLCALLAQGCSEEPTQIIIAVDSNLLIPSEINLLDLRVDQIGLSQPVFSRTYPLAPSAGAGGMTLPATMTLLAGDTMVTVEITATGKLDNKSVVQRRARLPFVKGRAILVLMDLLSSCARQPRACPPDQTCTASGCALVELDPATLPNYTEREALAPMDAAVETGAVGDGSMEAGSELGPRDGGPDLKDGGPDLKEDSRTDALRDAPPGDADGLDGPASDAAVDDAPRSEASGPDGPLADGPASDGSSDALVQIDAAPQMETECLDSTPLGAICGGGFKFSRKQIGTFFSPTDIPGGWVVMPGGCANQINEPSCSGDDFVQKNRAQAEAHCQSLVLQGYDNWQLPDYHFESTWANDYERDLEKIYDLRAQIPGLVISTNHSSFYWTKSHVEGSNGTQYWAARFWQPRPQNQGYTFHNETMNNADHFFRCVRDYQP